MRLEMPLVFKSCAVWTVWLLRNWLSFGDAFKVDKHCRRKSASARSSALPDAARSWASAPVRAGIGQLPEWSVDIFVLASQCCYQISDRGTRMVPGKCFYGRRDNANISSDTCLTYKSTERRGKLKLDSIETGTRIQAVPICRPLKQY